MVASLLFVLALLGLRASAKTCRNITVPVTISSRNAVFNNTAVPQTNLDATTFAQNLTRQGQNFTNIALTGYATVSGTYNISAEFCVPCGHNASLANPTLQILTHGIGFDKTYWDLAYNNYNYSYVDVATDDYGYCTLAYDRLGIGNSSHGEPRNEIQSYLEIAALASITQMFRNGSFPTVPHAFNKIVHVGHSFGSAQTYALTAMARDIEYPNISDAAILTGFSMNGSFVGYFGAGGDFQQANLNQPFRFGSAVNAMAVEQIINIYGLTDVFVGSNGESLLNSPTAPLNYANGYLAHSNVNALQYLFLLPPYFDTNIAYYGEESKQPVTIGELLTLGSFPATNTFAGPVLVVTGSGDLPYCGGNCLATGGALPSVPAGVKANFPNAKNFEAYIQPNTGHGINFHYNATAAYVVIQEYLAAQGLTGS